MEKKMPDWFCPRNPGNIIVGYCYTSNQYVCHKCSKDHKEHKIRLLSYMQDSLAKKQNDHKSSLTHVKDIYDQELGEIQHLRSEIKVVIEAQIQPIQEFLDEIKVVLQGYLNKVDTEYQEAYNKVAQLSRESNDYKQMMKTIIDAEDITTSAISPAELQSYSINFGTLVERLQGTVNTFKKEKDQITTSFNNFRENLEQTLIPLNNIQDTIKLCVFRTDNASVQSLADAEYDRMDPHQSNALPVDAMVTFINSILERANIQARPNEYEIRDVFAQFDVMKAGILTKSNAAEFAKAVIQGIK